MKQYINKHIKDYKFGLKSKEETQRAICTECIQYPDRECKYPCMPKKIMQNQKFTGKKTELPQQRQYKGCTVVIEPNNIEQIQKAQLDKIGMATLTPNRMFYGIWLNRHTSRYFYQEGKRKYIQPVMGNGHTWTQHLSYQIGSERSMRVT